MHELVDCHGDKWRIKIVIDDTVKQRLPEEYGIDLLRPEKCVDAIADLLDSPATLLEVIWLFVEDQAYRKGIETADDFWSRFSDDGDYAQLVSAFDTFDAALRFFIRTLRRGSEVATAILTKIDHVRQIRETRARIVSETLVKPITDEEMTTLEAELQKTLKLLIAGKNASESAAI